MIVSFVPGDRYQLESVAETLVAPDPSGIGGCSRWGHGSVQ